MSTDPRIDESARERVERYRRMADSTRELAARTDDPEIKAAYLDLARKWVSLANRAAEEIPTLVEPDLLDEPRGRRAARDDGMTA